MIRQSGCRYGTLETMVWMQKGLNLFGCLILDTYISFVGVSFRCIGSVLGIPRGIIGTKSGRKIFFFTLGQCIYTYTYTGQIVAPAL